MRYEDRLVVEYRVPNVILRGLNLRVVFTFSAARSQFDVEYQIDNQSGQFLKSAYVMVGFPGFVNRRVNEVIDALGTRRPRRPHATFRDEAAAGSRAEYLLLRHDLELSRSRARGARGGVSLDVGATTYRLDAYYFTDSSLAGAYSAHTNKPRYLTSHLYVTLGDVADGRLRSMTVHYDLSATAREE